MKTKRILGLFLGGLSVLVVSPNLNSSSKVEQRQKTINFVKDSTLNQQEKIESYEGGGKSSLDSTPRSISFRDSDPADSQAQDEAIQKAWEESKDFDLAFEKWKKERTSVPDDSEKNTFLDSEESTPYYQKWRKTRPSRLVDDFETTFKIKPGVTTYLDKFKNKFDDQTSNVDKWLESKWSNKNYNVWRKTRPSELYKKWESTKIVDDKKDDNANNFRDNAFDWFYKHKEHLNSYTKWIKSDVWKTEYKKWYKKWNIRVKNSGEFKNILKIFSSRDTFVVENLKKLKNDPKWGLATFEIELKNKTIEEQKKDLHSFSTYIHDVNSEIFAEWVMKADSSGKLLHSKKLVEDEPKIIDYNFDGFIDMRDYLQWRFKVLGDHSKGYIIKSEESWKPRTIDDHQLWENNKNQVASFDEFKANLVKYSHTNFPMWRRSDDDKWVKWGKLYQFIINEEIDKWENAKWKERNQKKTKKKNQDKVQEHYLSSKQREDFIKELEGMNIETLKNFSVITWPQALTLVMDNIYDDYSKKNRYREEFNTYLEKFYGKDYKTRYHKYYQKFKWKEGEKLKEEIKELKAKNDPEWKTKQKELELRQNQPEFKFKSRYINYKWKTYQTWFDAKKTPDYNETLYVKRAWVEYLLKNQDEVMWSFVNENISKGYWFDRHYENGGVKYYEKYRMDTYEQEATSEQKNIDLDAWTARKENGQDLYKQNFQAQNDFNNWKMDEKNKAQQLYNDKHNEDYWLDFDDWYATKENGQDFYELESQFQEDFEKWYFRKTPAYRNAKQIWKDEAYKLSDEHKKLDYFNDKKSKEKEEKISSTDKRNYIEDALKYAQDEESWLTNNIKVSYLDIDGLDISRIDTIKHGRKYLKKFILYYDLKAKDLNEEEWKEFNANFKYKSLPDVIYLGVDITKYKDVYDLFTEEEIDAWKEESLAKEHNYERNQVNLDKIIKKRESLELSYDFDLYRKALYLETIFKARKIVDDKIGLPAKFRNQKLYDFVPEHKKILDRYRRFNTYDSIKSIKNSFAMDFVESIKVNEIKRLATI